MQNCKYLTFFDVFSSKQVQYVCVARFYGLEQALIIRLCYDSDQVPSCHLCYGSKSFISFVVRFKLGLVMCLSDLTELGECELTELGNEVKYGTSVCGVIQGRVSCRGSGFKVVCNAQKVEVLTRSENDIRGLEGVSKELSCVMKFGGSSVASAERMKEVAALILRFPEESLVIVLSAMGKTTNKILLAGEKAKCDHLEKLERLLEVIAELKEFTPRTRDYLVSFGERMSTRIFATYLNKLGVKARQGKKTGDVTTLGRGGSDLTATTIGKALGLREIQFGLMNRDCLLGVNYRRSFSCVREEGNGNDVQLIVKKKSFFPRLLTHQTPKLQAIATTKMRGEYPEERPGRHECEVWAIEDYKRQGYLFYLAVSKAYHTGKLIGIISYMQVHATDGIKLVGDASTRVGILIVDVDSQYSRLILLSMLNATFMTYFFWIEIKELDEFAQAAFQGYKTINRIQSRIFQTTYHTNENILVSYKLFMLQVCARTRAGKTNIVMIAILHEVRT
ncbi:aspartokinase 2, chloroplastic [Artemisia annua]|uniref:Aspartokinase 2, chloroplastic n=1 Tax=Artemisia annua TaxID=35608 RepID=A0A2U1NQN2_ARTAN|nr:aspartokinase 2, chloroplastic [Artemisia annua]